MSKKVMVVLAFACGSSHKAVPDAAVDAPVPLTCGSANLFGTCAMGMKCTWIQDSVPDCDLGGSGSAGSAALGHIGCVPVGDVGAEQACAFNTCSDGTPAGSGECENGPADLGYDNCDAGLFCFIGRCESLCGFGNAGPSCDADHACDAYQFSLSPSCASVAIAGVCDERCDPNTQRTLDGSAEACRSTNPAEVGSGVTRLYPEFGCYENDSADENARLVDFTCEPTPFDALGPDPAEDRQPCTSVDGCEGMVGDETITFTNGCAPGYVNLLIDTTGSTELICSAYCSPLDTDTTTPGNALGNGSALGKDVTDPAAVVGRATCNPQASGGKAAGAGETCIYAWQVALDGDTGYLPTTSKFDIDTLGVCFDNSAYFYDPATGAYSPGTPGCKQTPSCATLLPGQFGDTNNCATPGQACGDDAVCLGSACHILAVACGSGSGQDADGDDRAGNEADCFAWDHGCYDSVESGVVAPDGSDVAPPVRRLALAHAQIRTEDRAAFRRPGAIR